MSIPTPPPGLDIPKQPPAVFISTVRTFSPMLVGIVSGLLLKAHVTAFDNTTLTTAVDWTLGGLTGLGWTFGVRLLETRVAPWWGRLLVIPRAPAYAPGPLPAPAPVVATYTPSHEAKG